MRIQVSHGADPEDWFVVRPLPGDVSTGHWTYTNEQAQESLRSAGRSVYEIDVEPWQGHGSFRAAKAAMREEAAAHDAP